MWNLIGDTLPLALAIALSPFPIIVTIMLLMTPRALPSGTAFLCGWVTGLTAIVAVGTVASSALQGSSDQPPTWASWLRIILGLLLIVYAVRSWRRGSKAEGQPAWMSALDETTTAKAARLGLLVSAANPKILVLGAAAGVSIGSDYPTLGQAVATTVAFVVIASLSVGAPLLVLAIAGDRMLSPLERARDWLGAHGTALTAAVLAILGAILFLTGLRGL